MWFSQKNCKNIISYYRIFLCTIYISSMHMYGKILKIIFWDSTRYCEMVAKSFATMFFYFSSLVHVQYETIVSKIVLYNTLVPLFYFYFFDTLMYHQLYWTCILRFCDIGPTRIHGILHLYSFNVFIVYNAFVHKYSIIIKKHTVS